MGRYISWRDPRVEPPVTNEDAKIRELLAIIERLSGRHFSAHRHGHRVTHVKTQAVVKGTLHVAPDLPPELAQGLFAPANRGAHPAVLRFANEPIFIQDDRAPGPRGVGMKVFDVQGGAFLDPAGVASRTQDLTFNNAPMLELRDLPTTLEIFRLREKYYDEPEKLQAALKQRPDAETQLAPGTLPNRHFLSYTMYSQSAYRFGDYVAKYALFPSTALQQKLAEDAHITDDSSHEQHSKWLVDFFKENDAEYDLRVQLLQDPDQQSVEDTSQAWDEERSPFRTVGHVTIPKGQDPFDAARRTFYDDKVRLNPWYGLEDHQPLGSVNRLRRELYQLSSKMRGRRNATDIVNVRSVDEIP